jgi:hypothetical protein
VGRDEVVHEVLGSVPTGLKQKEGGKESDDKGD